ncbi:MULTISPECIES: hypothetical protein [Streptomyces]|uniref:hypothetical protein n=1 Tax=Streptomyces TaxID=1883 RepID=UPI0012912861|nr:MULTISPECIES: hypothetical protein [Streptomyces]MCX5037578.1 hypothetical protein [Streptomyces coelicoflavus]QFX83703.1 hypothetical protein GEV49_24510 [Streptomyces sp. SYP-A7193]
MTVPHDDQPPAHPLQLGRTLYEVLDLTLLGTPKGKNKTQYTRVTYDKQGGTTADPLETVNAEILDVLADTDSTSAVQNVHLLTGDALWIIGSAGGAATSKTHPVGGRNLRLLVGLDPQRTDESRMQLLGQDANGVFLQSMDCSSGKLSDPLRLTSVTGRPVAGTLVRRGTAAHVVIATLDGNTLTLHDVGPRVLGPAPEPPTTVARQVVPNVAADAVVDMTAACLLRSTSDQQVAVACPASDGSPRLSVWDFGSESSDAFLLTTTPQVTGVKPERPLFRLAAADLQLVNDDGSTGGVQQLVVAYAGSYTPKPGTTYNGCGIFVLYELAPDTAGSTKMTLNPLTDHVACRGYNGDLAVPLSSIGLHVAAGLFGEVLPAHQDQPPQGDTQGVLGVVVTGCGASLKEMFRGEATVAAGLLPVDPQTRKFPSYSGRPGVPQSVTALMTVDFTSPGPFFALPSDVTGKSVVLGPPTFSTTSGDGAGGQLLAVVKSPPYEASVAQAKPTLVYGTAGTTTTGTTVSSNKEWTFTDETAVKIGVKQQSLHDKMSNSYGHKFSKSAEHSTTTSVRVMSQTSDNDMLAVYGMEYYVWTYPVYRKSTNEGKPDGTLAVVFPTTPDPVQKLFTAAGAPELGYVPRSTPGVLLSYIDADREGYDPSRLVFQLDSYPVSDEKEGSTVTYAESTMDKKNIGKDHTVRQTTSKSEQFSLSTSLLQYVPVNFGLDITKTDAYAKTTLSTTSLTSTTDLTVSIKSGAVDSSEYDYEVTPYIYHHSTMGCLMVDYDVSLTGKGWSSHYGQPKPLLIPLQPFAHDLLLRGYSRSVSFADGTADGTITVGVEIFNNGLQQIDEVVCEFYRGLPQVKEKGLVPPAGTAAGTKSLTPLSAKARGTARLGMSLAEKDLVTVKVYDARSPESAEVYWAIYPASAYTDWNPPSTASAARSGEPPA